jgi:hypothetical protein
MKKFFIGLVMVFALSSIAVCDNVPIGPFVLLGIEHKAAQSMAGYAITDWLEVNANMNWYESALALGVVGIAKEGIDVLFKKDFSWDDIGNLYLGYVGYRVVVFKFEFDWNGYSNPSKQIKWY